MPSNETIRVHIQLTIRKRGGRPRILPPRDIETSEPPPGQDPRVLRAIGRAWAWRKRMERGEITRREWDRGRTFSAVQVSVLN